MTEYVKPIDYKPGDTFYTDDGDSHIVEDSIGNMIYSEDGVAEIVPVLTKPLWDEDDEYTEEDELPFPNDDFDDLEDEEDQEEE